MKKPIPDPFGIDGVRFRVCFSAPGFRIFVALVIGWVLTVGKHTVSQVDGLAKRWKSAHIVPVTY